MKLPTTLSGPPGAGGAALRLAALLALLALPATAAAAQDGSPHRGAGFPRADGAPAGDARDPDGLPFRTPLASPLEPVSRLAVAHVARDTASRGVALPDLAARIPFRLHDPRPGGGAWSLAGEVVAGAFSRFDLESTDNEFLEVHYRAALRLRAGRGPVAARLSLYHVSSHLGDEHQERTGRSPISTSREGLELLVQGTPLPGLAVHAGPGLLFRSSRGLESPSVRAGAEWRRPDGGGAWYAAAEVHAWSELGWDPRLAVEAGRRLGRRLRLGLAAGRGPSRAEQFFREGERILGVVLTVLP